MPSVQLDLFGNVVGAEPFIQWMGGKRRLWSQMQPYFPREFGTYHEPFLGGGAVFLNLQPNHAVLGDASPALVNAWRVVKEKPDALIAELSTFEDSRDAYARARNEFNTGIERAIRNAALFVYLTHVSFNGMFRFNRSGQMNNSYGGGWNVPVDAIWNAHVALKQSEIRRDDFTGVADVARKGDLVYMDPPYDESDTSYLPGGWSTSDTLRVADVARTLRDRGCHVVVSNHNTPLVRDAFSDFRMVKLERLGTFCGDGDKRQPVEEVLILS